MSANILGNKQKFHKGNIVKIADELGSHMSHFESGCYALVLYSYADQYGGDNVKSYCLKLFPSGREVSWYEEHQLKLIAINKEFFSEEDFNNLKEIIEIEE